MFSSLTPTAIIRSGSSAVVTRAAAASSSPAMTTAPRACMPFSVSSDAWPASASGPLMRSLQLSLHQRERFTLQLRALDGVRDGASRREIAAVLLDPQARDIPAIEWTNAALRKRINRIIARATLMTNGGYLALLRGDADRARRFRRR